jgi:hypothetical protein
MNVGTPPCVRPAKARPGLEGIARPAYLAEGYTGWLRP